MSLFLTVTPGYQFSESELVTYAKLNQLGTPVLNLGGTIATDDIGIGAITLEKLADGINLASKMPDASIGLEKIANGTHGSILYCDSGGQWQQLGPGSDGQFLKTQGPDADPVWANQAEVGTITLDQITTSGANKYVATDGSGNIGWEAKPTGNILGVATIWDQKATNAPGGSITAGVPVIRDLNQIIDLNSITEGIGSNQFTLSAGRWHIEASAPGDGCADFIAYLYNVTDGAITLNGTTARSSSGDRLIIHSFVRGSFDIADTKTFEIRMQSTGSNSTGLGIAGNVGSLPEIYTTVTVSKIAT